jgi:hypothetical protein
VCGIDDVKNNDPRYTKPTFDVWQEYIPYNEEVFLGQKKLYYDKVYICGNPSGNIESTPVAGYIIDQAGEDFSRGLALALKWETDDHILIIEPDENPGEWIQNQYAEREGKDVVSTIVKEHRWLDNYTPWYVDLYLRRALHILHSAGWHAVTREMLKFMIVIVWS